MTRGREGTATTLEPGETMKAQKGHTVKVHYRGTLDTGEEFDSSFGGDPLEVRLGEGQLIAGFERNLMGMEPGEEKTFRLPPEEAYGSREEGLTMTVPKASLPAEGLAEGVGVRIRLQNGRIADGIIARIDGEAVTVDFNHPLAGKALTFAIKVVEVR